MTKSCHHIGIFTARPKALKNFYVRKLGFKLDNVREISKEIMHQIFGIDANCQLIRLRREGVCLELFAASGFKFKKTARGSQGYNHWALNVASKTRFCSLMKKRRVKVIRVSRGGYYTYFIQDPDGNLIEVRDNRF